ncbi:hypothetical protein [Muricaecibacterium torontonense]|uniref:hypothetical protein n=1 Tax=Muricaecibacterium torontonense TaxID=3032871 RepID=UPI001431B77F|nr:hypothetical protein [Muricaecibacterium torontonense]
MGQMQELLAIQFAPPVLHEFKAVKGNHVKQCLAAKPQIISYKLAEIGIYLHLFPPGFPAVFGAYLTGFAPVSKAQIDENSFSRSPLKRTHWL